MVDEIHTEQTMNEIIDNLMDDINGVKKILNDNAKELAWAHTQALQLREEHTALQAAFRGYLADEITAAEAETILNEMHWK